MSSRRVIVVGLLGLNVAGISVNGTSVSPSARTGVAHSGTNATRLAAASPFLRVSLRVICSGMVCLLSRRSGSQVSRFAIIIHHRHPELSSKTSACGAQYAAQGQLEHRNG